MKLRMLIALCALLASGGAALADGSHRSSIIVNPKSAEHYATLPNGMFFPEGIAANRKNGDIYVGTFDFGVPGATPNDPPVRPANNMILRFNKNGKLIGTRPIPQPLLGLEFNPRDKKLYIANFGASSIQRVAADLSGTIENVATFPLTGAAPSRQEGNPDGSNDTITFGSNDFPGPNAMVFDAAGNLYISDSFRGVVYSVAKPHLNTASVVATVIVRDGRLATAGFPPFGANGLAFNEDESILYIAVTGDDNVLQMDMTATAASPLPSPDPRLSGFAYSINGADGLAFDKRSGLLWVAANQADEMVALNDKGRVVARLGAFLGFDRKGSKVAARGLLFPASPVIVGDNIFVTNLALPLTGTPDEPETEVNSYTISRIDISERDDDHDD